MKRIISTIIILFVAFSINAQAPQAISYQAVARNAQGQVLANTNVSLRICILQSSTTGNTVYSETHNVTTNQFGLINIQIGKGTILSGIFNTIDWGANKYFTKMEIDIAGGTNYQEIGVSEMLSVPFAFYANSAKMIAPFLSSSELQNIASPDKGQLIYDSTLNILQIFDGNLWKSIIPESNFIFTISGITDQEIGSNSSKNYKIEVNWIDGNPENVLLEAVNLPSFVNISFSNNNIHPDYNLNMTISTTKEAVEGTYPITIRGTSEGGKKKEYSFNLTIKKVLYLQITVKDVNSWSPSNPLMLDVAGATVKLFTSYNSLTNGTPDYTLTTDANGVANFYDINVVMSEVTDWYVIVEQGLKSNIYKGYSIIGVFQSQAEIDSNPHLIGSVPGSVKVDDVNGDGKLNSNDYVPASILALYGANLPVSKTIYIAQ